MLTFFKQDNVDNYLYQNVVDNYLNQDIVIFNEKMLKNN